MSLQDKIVAIFIAIILSISTVVIIDFIFENVRRLF
jgi:hypothetical protein